MNNAINTNQQLDDEKFVDFDSNNESYQNNQGENDAPGLDVKNANIVKEIPKTWFGLLFGFEESNDFAVNKKNLEKMYVKQNNVFSISDVPTGTFGLMSNIECQNIKNGNKKGKVTFKNIKNDMRNIYKDPDLCANATIQVDTLLNCTSDVYFKITKYPDDDKMLYLTYTPAGLVYRNYILDNLKVDIAQHFFDYLETVNPNISYSKQEGQIIFKNDEQIRKINRVLCDDMDKRRNIRGKILSGYQNDQGVYIDGAKKNYIVNNVFCNGIPINKSNVDSSLWKGILELFLEAYYENTLCLAHQNNIRSGKNGVCYLVPLGDQYGVDSKQIARAIQRACHISALRGYNLDVVLVHKDAINNIYANLPSLFPLGNVNVDSIWDNSNWTISAK